MKNNSLKMILLFLAGVIIGGAIFWVFICGCCKKQCDHTCQGGNPVINLPQPATIDTVTANNYFNNYLNSPVGVDTLKAFSVNLEQYNAMRLILNADTTVQGFRIYMGATDTTGLNRITMVVGFGTPDHTETIYTADEAGSGLCPILCDESTPITKEN